MYKNLFGYWNLGKTMTQFYDLCIREKSSDIKAMARELGWAGTNCKLETVFLEADNWGELKKKIKDNRKKADLLIFKGGNVELNRKAAEDSRVDILLHPEKGRKDSGIDHVIAEEASENNVALGFDLQELKDDKKKQTHKLKSWRKNLRLCEKYGTPFVITSGAKEKYDLKAPRELAAILNSMGFNGKKAVSEHPENIVKRSEKINEDGFIRPGEVIEND